MKTIFIASLLCFAALAPSYAQDESAGSEPGGVANDLAEVAVNKDKLDFSVAKSIPVLSSNARRYQPLDTYSTIVVRRVTGKEKLNKTDSITLFLQWYFNPLDARQGRYLRLPDVETAKRNGLEIPTPELTHTSFDRAMSSATFRASAQNIRKKKIANEDTTAEENGTWNFWTRCMALANAAGLSPVSQEVMPLSGSLPVIPNMEAPVPNVRYVWSAPIDIKPSEKDAPMNAAIVQALVAMKTAFDDNESSGFTNASKDLRKAIVAMKPEKDSTFPGMEKMEREVRLNDLNPFSTLRFIWFGVLLVGLFPLVFGKRIFWFLAIAAAIAALSYHIWAIYERTDISGRAIIGNLYETTLFATAAGVVVALCFEFWKKTGWSLVASAFLAMLGLFWANSNPEFWQPEISKLQPVLINNDLIHIHVPTIMVSYAVLFLTVVLAHCYIFAWWKQGSRKPASETTALKELGTSMFWTIPVGVVLLFVGIILGGVWADASWGRFWGWDPKETASLVTWIIFVGIVHGWWAGWLRNLGTAIASLVGGLSLIWTYWGANFVQSGLHSYAGSGTAIPTWPYYYLGFEVVVVGITWFLWNARKKDAPTRPDKKSKNPGSADPQSAW